MNKFFKITLILVFSMSIAYSKNFEPPTTKMVPVRDTLHNFIFTDFYRWLENKNDPDVIDWSKSQHNYTVHAKKFVAALQNLPSQINPIMLYVDFESGHGSGQSTEQMIDNIELEWQFIMGEIGIQ